MHIVVHTYSVHTCSNALVSAGVRQSERSTECHSNLELLLLATCSVVCMIV